ncbi:MAG: hypothetical protein M0C28_04040 [Candidatus Moduliflexus flocculans]|nr:hypothetical protein [Candidatus Moduliflexus flocculans]
MRDVYEAKGGRPRRLSEELSRSAEGTKGVLVFIDGKPAGMDFVSSGQGVRGPLPQARQELRHGGDAPRRAAQARPGQGRRGEGAGQARPRTKPGSS